MSNDIQADLLMTAAQIRRQANDFDSQVRQGLEDGMIRQVVKALGGHLTGLLAIRAKGTPEQKEAFPKPLFLFEFVRAWNRDRNTPDFIETQLVARNKFDQNRQPPTPKHAEAPAPRPKHTIAQPQAGPSKSRLIKGPSTSRSPSLPANPNRPPGRAPTHLPRAAPAEPARHEDGADRRRKQTVEVVIPPRSPRTFKDLDETDDEYVPDPSPSPPRLKHRRRRPERSATPPPPESAPPIPAKRREVELSPSPPPPRTKGKNCQTEPSPSPPPPRTKGKNRQMEPSPSPPPRRVKGKTIELVVFVIACLKCERGKRDCVQGEIGAACVACKQHKYGCDKTGSMRERTMAVRRPAPDSEEEDVEMGGTKSKKRRAESPPPAKVTKVKVKKEKQKVEKPKASRTKPKGRQRAPPKSAAIVVDDSDGAGEMVVDEDSEEDRPRAKWARVQNFSAEHDRRLAVLEERVKAFDKVAEQSSRTSQRMDSMEDNVHRFTGQLERFLSNIRIDDGLRLVADTRRIGGSPSPGPLPITRSPSLGPIPITRSASPAPLLAVSMDEDSADLEIASSHPDSRTTPSDDNREVRMVGPGPLGAGSAIPSVPEPAHVKMHPLAAPLPIASEPALPPALHIIPATPQGSQNPAPRVDPPPSPPPFRVAEEGPAPGRHPPRRGRSRTPALLGVEEGPTTRARSRSKTPM